MVKIGISKWLLLAFLAMLANGALANPSAAFEGRRLYVSYCLLCHGADGAGDGPLAKTMKVSPANLTTAIGSRSDTVLARIITGRGEQTISGPERHNLLSASMPEWKNLFDPAQVDALIAYLRFLSRKKHELMGDPEHGAGLYQKYCQVCHGRHGKGDGILTGLIGVMPMDHTNRDETNSLDNEEMINSILEGKGRFMPAWKGILGRADVEALVSYIRLLSF